MARSATPAQYYPKFLGTILVAIALTSVLLYVSPKPAAHVEQVTPAPTEEPGHKNLMRRETPRAKVVGGPVMRREEPLDAIAGQQVTASSPARVLMCVLFGAVAIVGLAMQGKDALMQLLSNPAVQEYLGMKQAK